MRRVVARKGRGRAHLGGGLATAADLAATVAGPHRHRLAARSAVADRSGEPAGDPGRLRREPAAARRDGRRVRGAGGGAGGAGERSRPTRGRAASARICCASSWASWRRPRPAPGEDDALAAERERLRGAEKFFAATARGEETLYAGDGAVTERLAAVARELAPLAALDPALAPLVERLAERAGGGRGRRRANSAATRAGSGRIPPDWPRSRSACSCCSGSAASTAGRSPISPPSRRRCAPSWPSWARSRRGWPRGRRRWTRRRRARPRRRRLCRRRGGEAARRAGKEGHRRPARARVRLGAAARRDRGARAGAERRGPGPVPFRAQPRRRAAAAGQDRVGGRAVAGDAGGQAGAGAHGRGADLRVRRGRRRASAAARPRSIGRKLKRLAAERQVIVITHLPQVAAFADAHVRVTQDGRARQDARRD